MTESTLFLNSDQPIVIYKLESHSERFVSIALSVLIA